MKTDISFDASAAEEAFIEHYGIKGMHWGIRRDAYLDARRAKGQKRAQEYIQKAERLETKIIDLQAQKRTVKGYKRGRIQDEISRSRVSQKAALADAQRFQEGKRLTAKQSKNLRTALIVGGTLAAYGAYSATQSGNMRRLAVKGKQFILKDVDLPFKEKRSYARKDMDSEEVFAKVVRGINPNYGQPGTKMNCRRATMAYEMRRRGYDVEATRTTNARGQDTGGLYNATNPGRNHVPAGILGISTRVLLDTAKDKFKIGDSTFNERIQSDSSFAKGYHTEEVGSNSIFGSMVRGNDIFKGLSNLPNGARGEVGVSWNGGGGHSLAFEIFDGVPVIFDTQSRKVFRSGADIDTAYGSRIATAGFSRLDDLELDPDFLLRWVK